MKLRKYQKEATDCAISELNLVDSTLLVLPTGTGKTIIIANVCRITVGQKIWRVLILAHREELLDQARKKIQKSVGLSCSTEKAEQTCIGSFDRIVVGSVQSLCQESRLKKFRHDYFDLIITDEAHRSVSKSYRIIYDHFYTAKRIGVTATSDRTDMISLGEVYHSLAYEYSLPKAIIEGYLVPIVVQTIPIEIVIDTDKKNKSSDYSDKYVASVIRPYLKQIANEMKNHCMDRKTIVFLPLIKISQDFEKILKEEGFNTFEVNGNTENRSEILTEFEKAGKGSVIVNSMLLTEGYDCESIDCVIVLRFTKSRPLYCQMVGRGTRPTVGYEISKDGLTNEERRNLIANSNKKNLLILDFLWNTGAHDLVRPANIIVNDNEVAKKMTQKIEENQGAPIDINDLEFINESESSVLEDRENALARKIEEAKKKGKMLVNPIEYELAIEGKEHENYIPTQVWEMAPVSIKQAEMLTNLGICYDTIENAGKASKIIELAKKRQALGLATPKQIRMLERKGFINVGSWTQEQASKITRKLAFNGWRIPNGIIPKEYVPE